MDVRSKPRRAAARTQREIAQAALRLIDQSGLGQFSMRKLGTSLGIDPMTVYRRFDDQEDLFDEVAVEMFRGVPLTGLPWDEPWPEFLRQYGIALHDTLLEHPKALPLYAVRPVRSAEAVGWTTRALLKMVEEGVTTTTAFQILLCVNEHVIGHAVARSADLTASDRSKRPDEGSTDFNIIAATAAKTPPGAHFELGLTALINGLRDAAPHRTQ